MTSAVRAVTPLRRRDFAAAGAAALVAFGLAALAVWRPLPDAPLADDSAPPPSADARTLAGDPSLPPASACIRQAVEPSSPTF